MLQSLRLKNFRNHQAFTGEFSENGALFLGPNGAGKTSILEAMYFLATLRSFRHASTRGLLRSNEESAEIIGETDNEKLTVRWQSKPTKVTALFRNDIVIPATKYLKEKSLFAVLFSPEELQLPFAPPRERRRYLNRFFCPLFPQHLKLLRDFEKVLASRNALLRRIQENLAKTDELEFYDETFSKLSIEITNLRTTFFHEFAAKVTETYVLLSGKGSLRLDFQPDITEDPLPLLRKAIAKDIRLGATSRGAHHDDFGFLLDNKPLETVGSRGEVRSAIMALKIAEYDFITNQTGIAPILLLDDVFSELDQERRSYLIKFISGKQAFLSLTDIPDGEKYFNEIEVITLS